jgi:hypothetical protein
MSLQLMTSLLLFADTVIEEGMSLLNPILKK